MFLSISILTKHRCIVTASFVCKQKYIMLRLPSHNGQLGNKGHNTKLVLIWRTTLPGIKVVAKRAFEMLYIVLYSNIIQLKATCLDCWQKPAQKPTFQWKHQLVKLVNFNFIANIYRYKAFPRKKIEILMI